MKEVLKVYFGRFNHLFYLALLIGCLVYSVMTGALVQYGYLGLIIILLSPFIEYYTHKYFLHLPMPKNKEHHSWIVAFLDHIHYKHHHDPKDITHIFAQLWLTFPIFIAEVLVIFLATRSLDMTVVLVSALIAYYLFYEWCHFMAHSNYMPKNAYSRYMKKYHLWHHYKNEHFWYGITNPFADIVFGKFRDPRTTEKSLTVKTLTTPFLIEKELF